MDKEKVLVNLRKARQIIEAAPENEFDLMLFKKEKVGCNTIMCTAGWLASDPFFIKQGMRLILDEGAREREVRYWTLETSNPMKLASTLFGPDAFHRLFPTAFCGEWDSEIYGGWEPSMTEKDLALARIDRQILEVERA